MDSGVPIALCQEGTSEGRADGLRTPGTCWGAREFFISSRSNYLSSASSAVDTPLGAGGAAGDRSHPEEESNRGVHNPHWELLRPRVLQSGVLTWG